MTDEQARLHRIERTLGTLIVWLAQSSLGALSQDDARSLIDLLNEPLEHVKKRRGETP